MQRTYTTTWGAHALDRGVRFRLWAPSARTVSLVTLGDDERITPMRAAADGWYECVDERAAGGTRYVFEIDGEHRVADPASRFQPNGPEGPSMVVDARAFDWPEPFEPRPYHEHVIYELHVGTFTPEGTYAAAMQHLDHLAGLGITAIELMPLAEAPGTRNWGYDGVLHYAPSHNYGTPDDLKRFIVAAHDRGLAVLLDVVYNHFGPQGNMLHCYAPQFFSDKLKTPWGAGIDYGSPQNDAVRRYAIDNACYWLNEYAFDGLRLDATPMILDSRPEHILHELLREAKESAGRRVFLIAEDVKNEVTALVAPFDGRWSDDVHDALHVAITGDASPYYRWFAQAPIERLGVALTSEATHRVNFLQNHDQVGNRPFGERITQLATPEAVRAASAVLFLAPAVPLLFMGEEWGASTPFLFFCNFEGDLAKRVTEGRRQEFAGLAEFSDPKKAAMIPDPSAIETFLRSKLDWTSITETQHEAWLAFHRELLRLRRDAIVPLLANGYSEGHARFTTIGTRGLVTSWTFDGGELLRLEANLGDVAQDGFAVTRDDVVFATHGARFDAGIAPPWSVRWSRGE